MNREIKFRAWDTEKNQWIYVSLGDLVCGATSKPSVPLGDEFTPADGDQSTNGEFQNWCEYTGLKDNEGREIYEGDIVEGHADGLGKIVWQGAGWAYQFIDSNTVGLDEICLWFGNNAVVIGNIYDNPELLQDPISSNES